MKPRIFLVFLAMTLLVRAEEPARTVHGRDGITLPPPPATRVMPVDDKFGDTTVTDPYRWLEDDKSPETRAWINREMSYTEKYLSQVKIRPEIKKRLTQLLKVESFGIPSEYNGTYFFTRRLANENQGSIYLRKGLAGTDERLIDATKLSKDQNTSVTINDISDDGGLLVYGVREGGADEESVHLYDVTARKELADVLPPARYSGISLSPDKKALYYAKVNPDGTQVFLHSLGADANGDQMIFGKKVGDEVLGQLDLMSAEVTENGRYLIISVAHGVPAKRVDIYAKDLRVADAPVKPIIHGLDNQFQVLNHEDDLYVLTDNNAANYRVVKVALADSAPEKWQVIVPEGKDVISGLSIAGGKLFATGLHDVVTQTRIFSLAGKEIGQLSYPTLGSASEVRGRDKSNESFYSFESFNLPPTIYHYDVATGTATVFAKPQVPFASDDYEVKQVFYQSKDGTRIPMFISSKKGIARDGSAKALIFAYGGFNVSLVPSWNAEYAWWMEQGGYYAQPNLRGGGEYGESWHKAAMFEKKQNVFDDLFAAAQYLIDNKYTPNSRLAIRGRSNGGLLTGVALTQRPDLWGAIWCGYPLLDMTRFQRFLVGKWWTTEYGSAEDPEQFKYLVKYSPYQNVKKGTKYPAVMFHTGDADTRVAPLHARKMTALVQADDGSDRPVLLHYDTKAGHSAGVSIMKLVDDTADELSFLWNETDPK
ncbi:MAG: S9 family peptidase [Chthoniobacterales bacterium]|nr:S9 family peptidase [Chthoniobacterales bacterium]